MIGLGCQKLPDSSADQFSEQIIGLILNIAGDKLRSTRKLGEVMSDRPSEKVQSGGACISEVDINNKFISRGSIDGYLEFDSDSVQRVIATIG